MSQTILGSISLSYEPIWNQLREIMGFRLLVEPLNFHDVDARHLLDTLDSLWRESAPVLLLSIQSQRLFEDVLEHATAKSPWIEVLESYTTDDAIASKLQAAHARGTRLVWRGEMGHGPALHAKNWFHKTLRSLTPHEALISLRVALRQFPASRFGGSSVLVSPVMPFQLYEGLGVSAQRTTGVYCGAGISAAHVVLALQCIGVEAAMYPGSWSAWSSHVERPVTRGFKPG